MAAEHDSNDYRGGLFDQMDVPSLVSLGLSFLGFLMLVLWLGPHQEESQEPDQKLEALSERMARILMPLKIPGAPIRIRQTSKIKPTLTEENVKVKDRINLARKRLAEHNREVKNRVSQAAVLSILSSTGSSSSRRRNSRTSASTLGGADLELRLSKLDGLTSFEERGTRSRSSDLLSETGGKADASGLIQKFERAKKASATKIGSLEFERPKLIKGNAKQASGQQLSVISSYINKNQTFIRLLYEERLKINPMLEGKITLVLMIAGSGKVTSVRIVTEETTLLDSEFQEDILRRVKKWIFPPFPGEPVELKSPFIFKPL